MKHSINKLLSYSLIKGGSSTEGFSLHPLVHFWAQERLNVKRRAELSHEALLILYEAFSFVRKGRKWSDRWKFDSRVAPHLDAVMENVMRYCSTNGLLQYQPKPPDLDRSHWAVYQFLDRTYGWLLWAYATFEERLLYLQQLLHPTPDQGLKTWQLAYKLGAVYQDIYFWEKAEHLYNYALVETWQNCPLRHPQALQIVGDLAYVILNQYRSGEALSWYNWALEARETVLGKDHPATMGAVYGIGLTLEQNGIYMEAYQYYLRAFIGREKILGPDNFLTINVMESIKTLADELDNLNHWNDSLKLRTDILPWDKRTLSIGQSDIIEDTALLARNYLYIGQPEKAEELVLPLLGNHTSRMVIGVMDFIARLYHQKGNQEEASIWYNRARDDARRVFGKRDGITIGQELRLAKFQQDIGQFDKSLKSYFRVVGMMPKRQWISRALKGIGQIIDKGYSSNETLHFLTEALAIMSDEDRLKMDLNRILGKALAWQGRFNEALIKYQIVASWNVKYSYEDTKSHVDVLQEMGGIFWSLNRYHEALEVYQKALALSSEHYREDDFWVRATINKVARAYFILEDFAKSLEWLERMTNTPLSHPVFISWMEEDIDTLAAIGRVKEAFQLRQLLEEARIDFSTTCLKRNSPFDPLSCAAL